MAKVRRLVSNTEWNITSREMRDILNSTHDAIVAVNEKRGDNSFQYCS